MKNAREANQAEIVQTPNDPGRVSGADANSHPGNTESGRNVGSLSTSEVVSKKNSGPRTAKGKERSKYNAIKHGIFSKLVLLQGEPRSELNLLLTDLRTDLEPVGRLEESLVDKLAIFLWRHRRVLIAETAEIQKEITFFAWDEERRDKNEAIRVLDTQVEDSGGLELRTANPHVLDRCIHLLELLKSHIRADGFQPDGGKILAVLYGRFGRFGGELDINFQYHAWGHRARCSDEERKKNNYPSPDECVANYIQLIQKEIENLERKKREERLDRALKKRLDLLSVRVPNERQADRLLRYESYLERGFDRALSQLERLQRLRRGLAAQPQINVNVSSS